MATVQRTRLASLDCIVVDGGPAVEVAVVICHGYGASYEDLAPLAGEWISMLGDKASKFRFVFPDAPSNLAELGMPEGRAWWPLNMARLAEIMQTSRFEELQEHEPPGIHEARAALCDTITQVTKELDGDATPLVLGGFSQGAMLAMDTALRGKIPAPQLLFQFSGTLICHPQWSRALSRLAGTRVFQSHGTRDPILPYPSAVKLCEMLQAADVEVDFHSFVGPHTIDVESVARSGQALFSLA